MTKGINLATYELKKNIIEVINNSHLPVCNIQSVLTEILTQVNIQFTAEVEKEKMAYEKELAESKEGEPNGKEIRKDKLAE
jgi:hypothetical protein